MKKFFSSMILAALLCVLVAGRGHSQSMEDVKSQIREQVKREMGVSDASQQPQQPVPQRRETAAVKKKVAVKQWNVPLLDELDDETLVKLLLVLMVIALLPAAIAKAKGRSFIAWWVLGVLFFIIVFPVSVFMKSAKRSKAGPSREKRKKAVETEGENPAEKDAPREPEAERNDAVGIYDKIERLAALKEKGVISEEEFQSKKNELLDRI